MCFEFFYNLYLRHFSFFEELSEIRSKMCIGLHVKDPLFLLYFNEKFRDTFSKKYSNIKFHTNSSSRSRVVPCGGTAAQTDVTKLIVAFRNFANACKNGALRIDTQ